MKQKIKKVLFLGSKELGFCALKAIHAVSPQSLAGIVTIDDSADSRTKLTEYRSFSQESRIPLFVVSGKKETEEVVRSIKPELCIVACWYWFISKETLSSVPCGFMILHNSLLPQYRGSAPLVWAIMNGEPKVGFSLFSATEGVDDGPLWAQGSVKVAPDDYIGDVIEKLEIKIDKVLSVVYPAILDRSVKPKEQKHALATFGAPRKPADGNIDWAKPAQRVYDFIRAQSDPYPGAFTFVGPKVMKIWRARLHDACYFGTPGQVAAINHEGVFVICGDDRAVILESVEMDNQRGKPQDFIHSIKTRFDHRETGT